MAEDLRAHMLNGDRLKIDDDDYTAFSEKYQSIAENAADCWRGFVYICARLKEEKILTGVFGSKVNEMALSYGTAPGRNFYAEIADVSSNMNAYIADIDQADGKLY